MPKGCELCRRSPKTLASSRGDYNIQKELLDELHEKQQKDVFVASCSVIQNEETGLVRTYCVWSAGIESWLPETDLIAFVSDLDGEPKMFTWDQAVAVVGDLMTPLDMYPPRFDVRKFPSVDRFAAMGAEEGI